MAKQNYHHGNLQQTLIDTAEHLLETKGTEALSLRGLAREAGVSQTAPYRHFEDKEALLIEVAIRGFDDFTKVLQDVVDANGEHPPKDQLTALSRAYIKFSLERSGVFQLMFLSGLLLKCEQQELAETATASFRVLTKVVARCQGKKDDAPSDVTVVASWAMMHGLAMLLTHDVIHSKMTGGMSKEKTIDTLTQMMLISLPD